MFLKNIPTTRLTHVCERGMEKYIVPQLIDCQCPRVSELLRKIHEISYRWSAEHSVPNDLIASMCEKQEEMGALSEVRLFIKQMIRCLDITEQGQAMSASNLLENLLESHKEMEREKTRQLEPAWDA